MADRLVRVDNDLIQQVRKAYPELRNVNYKALVDVALRKLLTKEEKT